MGPGTVQPGEVAVAGGIIPFVTAGAGAPVILLHGWTLDRRMWQPQIAGLGSGFLLVMPDRRGHGRATAPGDLAREADDIIAIADALGFDCFALVGLSQGAVVALDAARRFASRLTGLVVSGAPLPCLVVRDETIDLPGYRALVAAGDLAAMRRAWATHPLMQTHTPEAAALAAAMLADYDGRDLLTPCDPPALPRDVLEQLAVPVLALAGQFDTPWRRACAAALGRFAAHGSHAEIASAGHLANCDNPQGFNAAVGSFLRLCADPKEEA
ncbi:alpha/beta fold hydrolase [Sphingomonas changnyeongensis]|uniref:Alpha/beta fold hydrolase n=1 Tax=Sphingomonas changnyeongensis TaxID=2698679 RepID=A0A7Z2NX98_9SPHN|nr:alpha/beta hydrolase [Sphingomonas changnyeongensis]QHL91136.1 alpha/beta fold hydrolase [Sphingomonas changnyeongensis]